MISPMNMRNTEQNYYQVLEIAPTAQHQEVVAAYQRAKEAYAPDSPALYTMFTKEEASELRSLIEEAFQVLGNQTKRREYDQKLQNQNGSAPTAAQNNTNTKIPSSNNATAKSPIANNDKQNKSGFTPDANFEKEIAARTDFNGEFLKKVRVYKNINLEQIVKETRISRSYLAAIEADDFASLPAPVFLRGFVIQFAKYLGLNETLVASSYMARIKKDT